MSQITITINGQSPEQIAEAIRALAEAMAGAAPTTVSTTAPAPTATPEPEQPTLPSDSPAVSLETVRAKLAELVQAGKQEQVRALFPRFGADRLSGVDPKDYPALLKAAEELA